MEYIGFVIFFIYAMLAALVSAVAGMLACVGQACAEFMIASVQVHFIRPPGLPGRDRAFTRPDGGDPAKPSYFFGPARSDLRYVRQIARERWRQDAEWWNKRIRDLLEDSFGGDTPSILTPIGAGLAIGLIIGIPFAAIPVTVIWVMHEIAIDVASAVVRLAAATLRAIDSLFLAVRHIKLRCAACFQRIPYPAYLCPNPECEHIHWDIRPGRYGVLSRTCDCGRTMPTMLLSGAARKLEAICPYRACQYPLEYRPGEARETVLSIFGAKGAGKTLLLYGIFETMRYSSRPDIKMTAADSFTSGWLDDLESTLAKESALPTTPAVPPKAHVLRLQKGSQHRIIQFMDTAGELFYDSQRSADLTYLGTANTFVLVIDPLSISVFWDSLPPAARERFAPDRSAAPHPELAFQQTAERIAEMGQPRAQRALAVVFSRADLLGTEYGPGPGEGTGIRSWAVADLGLAGLLRQAESEFREVAFFHTAPFGVDENNLNSLINWLLRAEGIDPGMPSPLAGAD